MKRFTETTKWNDPWYRQLPPPAKLLWGWLVDNCDHAGVIEADLGLASFQIGLPVDAGTLSDLSDRVRRLKGGKLWLPKFIDFQFGELSDKCPAHKAVFKAIERHGLEGLRKGNDTLTHRVTDTLQDRDKDKDALRGRGAGEGGKDPCTMEEAKAYAASGMVRISPGAVEYWYRYRKAADWRRGGAGNPKVTSWQDDLAASIRWAEEEAAKSKQSKTKKL